MAHSAHTDPEMMEELQDAPEVLAKSIDKLVEWIRESKHLVVFTGAGVSTSAGIPDFRGPDGTWTLKAQGRERQGPTTSTIKAFPTICHMSLVELQNRGILKYLISQNCDGLHKRSGILPNRISELHGNGNIEYCETCGQEYLRDFHCTRLVRGRDHYTGRHCVVPLKEKASSSSDDLEGEGKGGVCNGRLLNSTIDFGQSLPVRPLQLAEENSRKADLHIVFGSSLTVSPACDMPRTTAKRGGRLVIVNLQKTPLFKLAKLNIRARCDEVMAAIMSKLDIPVPRWALKRELVFNCQANSKECVLSVQGIDPANRKLPASVCKHVTFQLPNIAGLTHEVLNAKEPYRLRIRYKDCKEKKIEKPLLMKALLSWRGHYAESDISLPLSLPLGKSTCTRYLLHYTPSLKQWDIKSEMLAAEDRKEWSPLMHSLMETSLIIEEETEETAAELVHDSKEEKTAVRKGDPEISNVKVQDEDEEMKAEHEGEKMEEEEEEKDEIGGRRGHPAAVWSASVVCPNEKHQQEMIVFGGSPVVKTGEISGISVYNLEQRKWRKVSVSGDLAFGTQQRWGHTATVCPQGSDFVYLIGGWDNRCQYGDMHLYDTKKSQLKELNVKPISPRAGHSAVCVGSDIYIFGGALCKGGPYRFYNDMLCFQTTSKTWTQLPTSTHHPLPTPRSQHSALALGSSHILVLGGYTGDSLLNDAWAFDLKLSQWKQLTVNSEEGGPREKKGLKKTDFRVRASTHTSLLLSWNELLERGEVLVLGLCGSVDPYLLSIAPSEGTMQWKKLTLSSSSSSSSLSLTAHSYISIPTKTGGLRVAIFGGYLNDSDSNQDKTFSYLRTFDVK